MLHQQRRAPEGCESSTKPAADRKFILADVVPGESRAEEDTEPRSRGDDGGGDRGGMRILWGKGEEEKGGNRGVGGGVGAACDGGMQLLCGRKGEMDEANRENMAKQGAGDRARSKLGGAHGDVSPEEKN